MKRVRLLEDHNPSATPDYHEWVHLGVMEYRDSLGRKNNGNFRRWMKVRCNNFDCPAEALISLDALEKVITDWVDAAA